ncbi:family 43 glycosylhydrolase [Terribacillus saccharophilus]|uniref:family 43 glycosylhydrolase n=1 Tax=Terribacillus saccharophilus TaxID=361277 RepID=UPI0039827B7C
MNITTAKPFEIQVKQGERVVLPKTVDMQIDQGVQGTFVVDWPELPDMTKAGIYEVEGTIIMEEFPEPFIEQRADPYILKAEDGFYYFTGSYPLYDRIVLRRSKTLEGLPEAEEHTIWRAHESGILSEHIWAPELHHIDGKWYMHFAAGEKEDVWAIRPYVLECAGDPLTDEWTEKGAINTDFQSFSLDATTFQHQGKRFLVWAQKTEQDTISNLYIAEMETPWRLKGKQVLLAKPEYDWEKAGFDVNEGPAFLHRHGKVFLTFSASATDDRYAMGLLYADENADLLDPASWTKLQDPVLTSSDNTGLYGPGHNSFTVTEQGLDLLVYHARPYKEIEGNPLYDHNRHARIQRFFWKDDMPYFGEPGFKLETIVKPKAIIIVE